MDYEYRKLKKEDYFLGFLDLINYFTKIDGKVDYNEFCKHYDNIMKENSIIYVVLSKNKIIGTGKLLIEYKFHNNLTKMGHIEDIVVNASYRSQGIGSHVINILIDEAKKAKCYKVTLNTASKNINFYKKCGFIVKDIEMCKYN